MLDGEPTVRVCVGYRYRGQESDQAPLDAAGWHECQPVYQDFEGWTETTRGAKRFFFRWMLLAGALLLVASFYSGVQIAGLGSALIAAAVLGLFNTLLRPLLVLLTLPVTLLTLGLFLFVINAAMFWLAAKTLDGFNVNGFGAALIGSLIYSALGLLVDLLTRKS